MKNIFYRARAEPNERTLVLGNRPGPHGAESFPFYERRLN